MMNRLNSLDPWDKEQHTHAMFLTSIAHESGFGIEFGKILKNRLIIRIGSLSQRKANPQSNPPKRRTRKGPEKLKPLLLSRFSSSGPQRELKENRREPKRRKAKNGRPDKSI
jgi:hypothetical protein